MSMKNNHVVEGVAVLATLVYVWAGLALLPFSLIFGAVKAVKNFPRDLRECLTYNGKLY
jgi:hypothetical protein